MKLAGCAVWIGVILVAMSAVARDKKFDKSKNSPKKPTERPSPSIAVGASYTLKPALNYHLCTDPDNTKQHGCPDCPSERALCPFPLGHECRDAFKYLRRHRQDDNGTRYGQEGISLEFYSCSGPVRSLAPYAYHRLQAWDCWKYEAQATYFWAFGDTGYGSSWNEYAARGTDYCPQFLGPKSVTAGKHLESAREGV